MTHPSKPRRLERTIDAVIGLALLGLAVTPQNARAGQQSSDRVNVGGFAYALASQASPSADATDAVRKVVDDYVGLYRRESLAEWRLLFLPTFTSTSTNTDGTVAVRTLDQFYDSQARGFARAKEMSETLENVVIARSGRLATAWADFVFHQDGTSRRGRLVLTLIEADRAWRIASLMFSY